MFSNVFDSPGDPRGTLGIPGEPQGVKLKKVSKRVQPTRGGARARAKRARPPVLFGTLLITFLSFTPWGSLGIPRVPWGSPGFPGDPQGTLGYPGVPWAPLGTLKNRKNLKNYKNPKNL